MKKGAYSYMSTPIKQPRRGEPCILELKAIQGVLQVTADQCEFGLTVKVQGQQRLVQKRTIFLTNSPEVAKELAKKCKGNHEHMQLKVGTTQNRRKDTLQSSAMQCAEEPQEKKRTVRWDIS